jgi:hypothetical protein
MSNLPLYRDRIALIKKQRDALDEDFAQVLAEGINEGHSIVDLLPGDVRTSQQKAFDL